MSDTHKAQCDEIKALADALVELEQIDVDKAFRRAEQQIRARRRRHLFDIVLRCAAVLSLPLLFASALLGYLYVSERNALPEYAEMTALPGTTVRCVLPDKSVAWLNAGSTLRYPNAFRRDKREVSLEGEAYFEVTADKKHPFYVNTPSGLTTYVYGTKFNVQAYNEADYLEVFLESGRVNVLTPSHSNIVLKPGEQLLYDKLTQGFSVSNGNVKEKTAWREGRLVFRDASLDYIFLRLEKRFNVKINFSNPNKLSPKFRATFTDESLPQILDYLSKLAPITWHYDDMASTDDSGAKRILTISLN